MSKDTQQAVAEKPNREALAKTGKVIEEIRRKHEEGLANATNDFERGYVMACSLIDLRQAVKQYMPVLKQLQGSKLGFLTDGDPGKDWKNEGPYPDQVVIECAIEAVVCGARWTGNEFNILAGGCYLTKNFWARKLREVVGLTDLDLNPGIPELVNGKAVVQFDASWKLDGRFHRLSRRFSILLRKNQTDDATIGKAEARMLKAVYRKVTGTEVTEADEPGVAEARPVEPARPAVGDRAKCDGKHGAPECGDPQCWQLDPPEEGVEDAPDFNWNAPPEDVEREKEREKLNAAR
jgi:hypothetical protein